MSFSRINGNPEHAYAINIPSDSEDGSPRELPVGMWRRDRGVSILTGLGITSAAVSINQLYTAAQYHMVSEDPCARAGEAFRQQSVYSLYVAGGMATAALTSFFLSYLLRNRC